jgi:hypothetical protein
MAQSPAIANGMDIMHARLPRMFDFSAQRASVRRRPIPPRHARNHLQPHPAHPRQAARGRVGNRLELLQRARGTRTAASPGTRPTIPTSSPAGCRLAWTRPLRWAAWKCCPACSSAAT